ncbi:MAG: hypothetical protein ACE5HJ_07860 [Thermoplasmata archaeon]
MRQVRYEDKYPSSFITGPMVGLALIVGSLWLLVLLGRPLGLPMGPAWLPPLIIVLAVAMAWNYRTMSVELHGDGISVGFGIIKRQVSWEDVRSYRLVRGPEPRRGDLGYNINRVMGVWRASYIGPVPDRVLFRLKKGLIREVFISVTRPEEFMGFLRGRIGSLRED